MTDVPARRGTRRGPFRKLNPKQEAGSLRASDSLSASELLTSLCYEVLIVNQAVKDGTFNDHMIEQKAIMADRGFERADLHGQAARVRFIVEYLADLVSAVDVQAALDKL
jgi:hypothetical protein